MIEQQQQGSMTLLEFAALHDLTLNQVRRLAKGGGIMGAQRKHTGHWLIFPPAKILGDLRICVPRKRPSPYDDQRVKDARHVLTLFNAKQPYSVQLTGGQILSIEKLISRECEALKRQRVEDDDQLENSRSDCGDRLQCLYTTLHVLHEVAKQGGRS
jgi:hypothetical protein